MKKLLVNEAVVFTVGNTVVGVVSGQREKLALARQRIAPKIGVRVSPVRDLSKEKVKRTARRDTRGFVWRLE